MTRYIDFDRSMLQDVLPRDISCNESRFPSSVGIGPVNLLDAGTKFAVHPNIRNTKDLLMTKV